MHGRLLPGISSQKPEEDALQNMTTSDISPASQFSLGSSPGRSDVWLRLGRIALGSIFVVSGFGKLTHFGGFEASLALKSVPLPWLAAAIGAPVEFFGGVAIVLGVACVRIPMIVNRRPTWTPLRLGSTWLYQQRNCRF